MIESWMIGLIRISIEIIRKKYIKLNLIKYYGYEMEKYFFSILFFFNIYKILIDMKILQLCYIIFTNQKNKIKNY